MSSHPIKRLHDISPTSQKHKNQQAKMVNQQIYYNQIDNIFEIAAWYGIALAKGHAFVDGNKRTALAVMLTFLEIQGIDIQYDSGLDDLMVDIVESQQDHVVLANLVAEFLCELQTKDFY